MMKQETWKFLRPIAVLSMLVGGFNFMKPLGAKAQSLENEPITAIIDAVDNPGTAQEKHVHFSYSEKSGLDCVARGNGITVFTGLQTETVCLDEKRKIFMSMICRPGKKRGESLCEIE